MWREGKLKTFFAALAVLFAAALAPATAQAQMVVAACGTVPNTMPVGYLNQMFVFNQQGQMCVYGTFVASVTQTGINVAATPAIQNASYVSGNCMGGFQTIALGTGVSVLSQVSLSSQGGIATAKQIYVFSANPSGSTCTDKSTFTIATADLSKLLYTGSITPAAPTGTTKSFGALSGLALGVPSGGTVYAAIIETTTETPATTSDLVLMLSAF